ncbi:MAG: alanyl-tRNA editing protein AlaXM [Thermofilaceae archaeon]
MVKLLYQYDSYLKEFSATVVRVEGSRVFLDQTAFHPGPSGGLDHDRGYLIAPSGERLEVVQVLEEGGDVAHVVAGEPGLKPGDTVRGVIDWGRRYRMMRLHTASHVLLAVLYRRYGALVTGGHITPEGARDDFDLSGVDDWKRAVAEAVEEANRILADCLEVKVYWLPRDEALRIPGIVKLAERLPPEAAEIRVVEIPGVDIQADGGPHVRNTCEVGRIVLQRLESKGARRKRAYYTVEP